MRSKENLEIEGYKCFSRNIDSKNVNSKRGSGGVAVLIKNVVLKDFKVEILNDDIQDIMWLKFSNNEDVFYLCICFLPLETGKRWS